MNLTAAQPLHRQPIAPPLPRGMVHAAAPQPTIIQFMREMHVSQWAVVLYPIVLTLLHRRRSEADVAVVDGSATAQIAITMLLGVWIAGRLVQSLKSIERVLVNTPLRWLLMYVVLAVMSAAWSGMANLTAFRGMQLLIFLLIIADAIVLAGTPQNVLRLQLLYALMVALCWQVLPALGELSIAGLHGSDVPGAIVGIVFVGWLIRGRQWRMLHAGLVVLMLLATSAATGLAIVGGVIISLILCRGRAAVAGWMLLCAMGLSVLVASEEVSRLVFWGKTDSTIQSGSGRIPIWQWILTERLPSSPIVGFGFGFGEAQARLYNVGGFRMQHMHNATMSSLVNLGAAGAALWLLFCLALIRRTATQPDLPVRILLLGGLTAVFINGLACESVTAPLSHAWIGHAMFFAMLSACTWIVPRQAAQLRPWRPTTREVA